MIVNLLILLAINQVFSANILYISPVSSRSHHIWNSVLARGLNEKGHNITMLTHDDDKSKPKNYHMIILEGIYDKEDSVLGIADLLKLNPFTYIKSLYDWSKAACIHDFRSQGLTTLMNYPKDYKFDLIVFDITTSACLYPLIDRFHNPPVVGVTPFLLPPVFSHSFGNPLLTSYMPVYSMPYTNRMNLKERLINFIVIHSELLYRKYVALPEEFRLAQKYFGDNIRPLEDIERSISILLSNTDPNLENPLDLPPNIIPVGGLQAQPAKLLPKDLQQIVNNAKDGVIVFSLGSILKSKHITETKRIAILNAFAKLPQTVLWKFENDKIEHLPKNVVIRKWLPQSDLLAHPNIKLLINHGGGLSSHEAIYHGVPVVAMPIFADQTANAGRLVNRNMAKMVDYNSLTEDSFYGAIKEVLDNPMYSNNIKTLSKRYRDKLNTPLETAIFWIEYVLRHGGAHHLNLPSRDMSLFQIFSFDVYTVILLGLYLTYSAICLLFTCSRAIFHFVFKKS